MHRTCRVNAPLACVAALPLLVSVLFAAGASAQNRHAAAPREADAVAALERTMGAAEASLREHELSRAESQYRTVLYDGWMILGQLHVAAGRLSDARDAFRQASASAVDADAAWQMLALVQLQLGDADEAVALLTRLAGRAPRETALKRLLAEAQLGTGQVGEAVQTLEEARTADPKNAELTFALGSAYLRAGKVDQAAPLFAAVRTARPGPDTDVLIGRTYRDFGFYDRARASLERALTQNPRILRAHYYLGTALVMENGVAGIDAAIKEFEAELTLAPHDPATHMRLGMALVEAQRPDEALPHLKIAVEPDSAPADAFYYVGRCQLSLGNAEAAVAALQEALRRASAPPSNPARVRGVQYQLGIALRQAGREAEAAEHFDAAKAGSERRTGEDRERLREYMTDDAQSDAASRPRLVALESPFAALAETARGQLERGVRTPMARAYMNLGVMQAQAQRFGRAAEELAAAAALDPQLPQVQYSLGVAYFNAQQYTKAAAPLERAAAEDPSNIAVRRMLALAWFNADVFDKAADLLAADPGRESDPSLQYMYGLALVRADRAAEAEQIFSRLLALHSDSADVHVVLGQAHAQQGDYDAAVASMRRALELNPKVAEANATLGTIFLKQGRLADAAAALRAELSMHPGDVRAQQTLATVLELDGQSADALSILRRLTRVRPDSAPARYLMGKILLTQGATSDAIEQLQAAIRLAPEDAEAHYQLGQAYRQAGRSDLADEQFAAFRQLKDKRRGGVE